MMDMQALLGGASSNTERRMTFGGKTVCFLISAGLEITQLYALIVCGYPFINHRATCYELF